MKNAYSMHFINISTYTDIKKMLLLQSWRTHIASIHNKYTNIYNLKCLAIINNLLVRFFVQHLHICIFSDSKDTFICLYSCYRHFWFYICFRLYVYVPNFPIFNTYEYLLLPQFQSFRYFYI